MSERMGGRGGQPHPATVQRKERPPHPATVAQPRTALGGAVPRWPPHPATVVQPLVPFGAQARPPHPATAPRRDESSRAAQPAAAYTRADIQNWYATLGFKGKAIPAAQKAASIGTKLGLSKEAYKGCKAEIVAIVKELDNESKFATGTTKIGKAHALATASTEVNTYATAIAQGQQGAKHGDNGERYHAVGHAVMRQILTHVRQVEEWDVSNCAEVAVVDKWLEQCGSDVLTGIKVTAYYRNAKPKAPCRNCSQWLTKDGSDYVVHPKLAKQVLAEVEEAAKKAAAEAV